MSRLSFFCAVCGHSLVVGVEHAGSLAECPSCERIVPVPGWRPPARALAGCLGVYATSLLAVDVKFQCPSCRAKLKVDARWGGQTIPCPSCAKTMSVPQWYGDADEIGDAPAQSTPALSARGNASSLVLSPEELAFLGANQEAG